MMAEDMSAAETLHHAVVVGVHQAGFDDFMITTETDPFCNTHVLIELRLSWWQRWGFKPYALEHRIRRLLAMVERVDPMVPIRISAKSPA